jgi:hypothetical protein
LTCSWRWSSVHYWYLLISLLLVLRMSKDLVTSERPLVTKNSQVTQEHQGYFWIPMDHFSWTSRMRYRQLNMQYNWGMYVLSNIFCIQLINLALKFFVGHCSARPRDKPRDRLHHQGLTTLSNFSSFG